MTGPLDLPGVPPPSTDPDEKVPAPREAPGDPTQPGRSAPSVSTAVPPRCPTRTRCYRDGELIEEGFPAEEISERLAADDESIIWLDLRDPDSADLQILVEEFGLHPLAVEDAVSPHQRPKLDRYPSHLFANMYAVAVDTRTAALTVGELSTFVTPRALITVRKDEFDIDALIARWDAAGAPVVDPAHAVGVLLHGLLDAVVDGHFAAVEDLDDATEDLEALLFADRHGEEIRRRAYQLGSTLAALRRVVAPMQEVLARLERPGVHVVEEELAPYFHDVADHAARATDTIEAARERITRVVGTELNEQGARLNDITKKLAAWAAIIAVPTAITGFFGQNVPYPGFGHEGGFVASCVMIVALGLALFVILRRNRWL